MAQLAGDHGYGDCSIREPLGLLTFCAPVIVAELVSLSVSSREQYLCVVSNPIEKKWRQRRQDKYDRFWQGWRAMSLLQALMREIIYYHNRHPFLLPTQNGQSRVEVTKPSMPNGIAEKGAGDVQ
jgi:hypothetical protein